MKLIKQQPWLNSASSDSTFILLPAVLPLVIAALFPGYFSHQTEVTSLWWIILVLNIDVAHVYSTMFRFYWDKETYHRYKVHLILIPLIGFVAGAMLYSISPMGFWRVLAYIAVFHFIRQQYGFMRLYSRKETYSKFSRTIDAIAIYAATMFPLLYWHIFLTGEKSWFVKGDFIVLPDLLAPVITILYGTIIIVYLIKEIRATIASGIVNIPKNALIIGTFISWYAGIIYFRGDLLFTMLNVVAHGIPYMALIYFYGKKKSPAVASIPWKSISIFIVTILVFAYVEEGLWDVFVWRDHKDVFPFLSSFTEITNESFLALIVPFLALPQITHYVLDGFIWKLSKEKALKS